MVFFAFHQYLITNFHLTVFFAGKYISVHFAPWNDVSIYFVSNILQVVLVFIFCGCLCYARKEPHKVQAFFYKIFEELNNDLYLWKSEVTTRKTKYSILASILHIFQFFFYRASYLLLQKAQSSSCSIIPSYLCKNLSLLIEFSNLIFTKF